MYQGRTFFLLVGSCVLERWKKEKKEQNREEKTKKFN